MNKKVHIKVKYLLLLVLATSSLMYLHFFKNTPKTTTKTSVKTSVQLLPKTDSTSIDLTPVLPVKKEPYYLDTVTGKVRVNSTTKTISVKKKTTEKKALANVYKDTVRLKNAKVIYNIVSPSKLFRLDFKVLTNDKLITKEITTTKTREISKNTWFLNYEPKFTIVSPVQIIGHAVSIDYTMQNKLRIGGGIEYNNYLPNKLAITFKIGIEL